MGEIFSQVASTKNKELAEYILLRTGDDLLREIDNRHNRQIKITYDKVKNKLLYLYLKAIRFLLIPKNLRDLIFVNTSIGEKHQWMYDSFSLSRKLSDLGFKDISNKIIMKVIYLILIAIF